MSKEILAINYDVWISGTLLDIEKKQCISTVQIQETVDGSDICTIVINDPEFLFIEDNIFIEDNKVKVRLGWSDVTYRVNFEGYISAIDIDFANDGIPKLTMTCMDNTHIMNRTKKDNTYKDTTSAEVVKKIIKSYGFKCVVDTSYSYEKQETITQSDSTDIDFINKMASDEVYPFTSRLIGDTFYYVKKGNLTTPKMTLTYLKYPHEIISFKPKINKESIKKEITSSKVDPSTKKVTSTKLTSTKTSDSKTSDGGGSASSKPSANTASGNSYTYNPKTGKWN